MTLIEFLEARIAEDEEVTELSTTRVYVDDDGCVDTPTEEWADGTDRLPNHHNTWWLIYDPKRARAECAAKRRIIGEWEQESGEVRQGLYLAAQILALPYADHPDYVKLELGANE
jgi:hypothetical protein